MESDPDSTFMSATIFFGNRLVLARCLNTGSRYTLSLPNGWAMGRNISWHADTQKCGTQLVIMTLAAVAILAPWLHAAGDWGPTGKYSFTSWAGSELEIFYSVPPGSDQDTPILIVIPAQNEMPRSTATNGTILRSQTSSFRW